MQVTEFDFNKKKGTVTCQLKYRGDKVFGIAKCGNEDNYNEEFGKALAYARAEERIRVMEVKIADEMKLNLRIVETWKDTTAPLISQHMQIASDRLRTYRQYLKHQRNMVKFLEESNVNDFSALNYRDILKVVSDKVFEQEGARK